MKRHALVTGGSRGIGFHTARRLLADGFRVTITGRNPEALERSVDDLDAHVSTLALDATAYESSAEALSAAEVDVLVANVGVGFSASVADTSVAEWLNVLNTNTTSAFVAIRSVLPHMLARRYGRIVTIGSFASHQPVKYGAAYTTSKHALWGLTRAVALDTRGTGVTANMVAPAFVRTEMTRQNAEHIATASGRSTAEVEQQLAAMSDLGRLIEPDEVAAEVAALVAKPDITGALIKMGDVSE